MNLIDRILKKIGRKNTLIDKNISTRDLIILLTQKVAALLRGYWLKIFIGESKGILFVGKRTKISYKHKITLGRTVNIGSNVNINALSKNGISIGNNVSILDNSIIECTGVIRDLGEGLKIGDGVGIAQNAFIQVRGKVSIGNNVIFGPYVSLFSENHNFSDKNIPIKEQGETRVGVIIEDGVWLASRVTVLDGVTVGSNSLIAAGAVVTKDVPKNEIWGGVPARFIKKR